MLANLNISQKLYAGFGVVLLIILVLVLSTWRGFDQVERAVRLNIHTYDVINESADLLASLINIETGARGFVITGREQFLGPLDAGQKDFQVHLAKLRQLTRDNSAQQRRFAELQASYDQWQREDINGILELRRQVAAGTQSFDALIERVAAGDAKVKMDAMRRLLSEIQAEERGLLEQRTASMNAAKSLSLVILLVGGLIATALAVSVAFLLSRSIAGRLQQVVAVARNVAQGRLDSTIERAGRDEIGVLLDAFVTMQERLREMIGQIRIGAGQLVDAAQNISNASTQLSVSTHEQSQAASSMAATVEELTVSINHVADNAKEAHGLSSDSGRQSAEGGAVIQETLSSMQRIADTVQGAAAQIAELGQHSDQISSIVNVIKEIADQTNLLALNAAIEAARAGEQGRGFAVVADEVRLLAQRTANSTQEITEMIKKIQLGTRNAVSNMEIGVQQVNGGVEQASQAGDAIIAIRQASASVVGVVDQISLALREQTVASQDVARNVERIAQMSMQNSEAVADTSRTAQDLQKLALTLEKQVASFRF
ncbi:methyl-accepting chemotaxis protein [Ectopseudomonas hydrolytica]|uniref:methyl-accepting chemotaxis protein n=1 Tax=Ectopseudomonas hydrolytica TaxID=2493633 RepID=UPI0002787006|nr:MULTISPECIES: methyl-accepting chemotaxis protein [Pseudomonas]ARS48158.1 chemotaxis protein [Pseudomonas mendocina]EJO91996.1 methyl-accepting chemotaxis transducer [Pseudomonas mendocina DLHK]MBA4244141.1 methyl-accepting chemotaxis protein II [Pseudomonas sp.]MBF8164087.1 methyl-accepting chemotaxis protein [Pseudomonas mendocina]UTH33067.1 methyl-accepting chemotaxis protein [Pseudomonas hydrolytica]